MSLWKNSPPTGLFGSHEINLEFLSYAKHHFDTWVSDVVSIIKWKLTTIYGHPEVGRRCDMWKLMKGISNPLNGPWFCFETSMRFYYGLKRGKVVIVLNCTCKLLELLIVVFFQSLKLMGLYSPSLI